MHVPYKDLPEAVNDVVAGRVDLLFDNLGSAAPLIKGGNLKAIAVGGGRRNALLPDLPSLSEAVPGFPLRHLVRHRCATQDAAGDRREAVCSHGRDSQDS